MRLRRRPDPTTGNGQARALGAAARASNAAPQLIVDYARDSGGFAQVHAIRVEALGRLHGAGGHALVGEKGDVSSGRVFTGRGPELQHFRGAAALAANPVTYRETLPMIDNGSAEGDFADPARRIFAQRLARRTG